MAKKKGKKLNPGKVIIPGSHPNPPEQHEVDVAFILARHFRCAVEFLVPVDDYKRKSADVLLHDVEWEIKCPKGNSKSTIRNQFRRASRQSKNIIVDTRRTKLKYSDIEESVLFELKNRPYIRKIILIDKSEKIIEIQK